MKARPTCTYLYADGHAVIVYEKQDPDAGLLWFVEIVERWTEATLSFSGRIVIGRYSEGLAWLCKGARVIRAKAPSLDSGSEGTRAKGIVFGTLEVVTKGGSLYFHDMPGTISGPYHYQPQYEDVFDPNVTHWGNYPVARVHRVKAKAPLAEVSQ